MIRAFSQRISPPYSGQVQIAESERARALTLDGKTWEIQFIRTSNGGHNTAAVKKSYYRVAMIEDSTIKRINLPSSLEAVDMDERILELSEFLVDAKLPFPAADIFEYWLLDDKNGTPLAMIFSCCEGEQMADYPARPEWTALPASMMKIEATEDELAESEPPVNYRLERLVAERAGQRPYAQWFTRRHSETETFPSCLLDEQWEDEADHDLCQRYIQRQAPRLLMLHSLEQDDRQRLEICARNQALEVDRFYPLYPYIVDEKLMSAIRVEARLRQSTTEAAP